MRQSTRSTKKHLEINLLLICVSVFFFAETAATQVTADSQTEQLNITLDALFKKQEAVSWGIYVYSLDKNEKIYALHSNKLFDPASTIKIATLAVAAEKLGWDFRYETTLSGQKNVEQKILLGDLVVKGTGDPTISKSENSTNDTFSKWARELSNKGIKKIDGNIVGDDQLFSDDIWSGWVPGWAWDDFGFGFAAPTDALQYNENVTPLIITPGTSIGEPAITELDPLSGLNLINQLETGHRDSEVSFTLRRLPGPSNLILRGSIPLGFPPIIRNIAVENSTLFFVTSLRSSLIKNGVNVIGKALEIGNLSERKPAKHHTSTNILIRHHSKKLSHFAVKMMKDSSNLYAESLMRSIGYSSSARKVSSGVDIITDTLISWGLNKNKFLIADGSGLSPLNLASAEMLVAVLKHMHSDVSHRNHFTPLLPVAGIDGTLRTRLRGSSATNNAIAKTGSKRNVSALAGYVNTQEGERLAFAILANNFTTTNSAINKIIDSEIVQLSDFSRR